MNTLDGSKYNIIISNTQKIILKAQHKEKSAVDRLFNDQIPGQSALDDVLGILQEISNNDDLMSNQRFEKLTRLSQMGIYVDEAHHMFGADLEKALHENGKGTSLRNTINELAKELAKHGSNGQLYSLMNLDKKEVLTNRKEIRKSIARSKKLREIIDNSSVNSVQEYFSHKEELLRRHANLVESLNSLIQYTKDVEIDMELQREIYKKDYRMLEEELKKESF